MCKKGHIPWNKGLPKEEQPFFGKKHTEEFKKNLGERSRGENNYGWMGNNISYSSLHQWFRKTFGKPYKCENINCDHRSKRFHWALMKGKKYEKKRENFWMLCSRCHSKYDWSEEKIKSLMRKKNNKGQFIKYGGSISTISLTGLDERTA